MDVSIVFVLVLILLVLNIFFISELGSIKQEAFDRGYMVECLGKKGYYWDCENE